MELLVDLACQDRVEGLGVRGYRALGLGFRVWGLGFSKGWAFVFPIAGDGLAEMGCPVSGVVRIAGSRVYIQNFSGSLYGLLRMMMSVLYRIHEVNLPLSTGP